MCIRDSAKSRQLMENISQAAPHRGHLGPLPHAISQPRSVCPSTLSPPHPNIQCCCKFWFSDLRNFFHLDAPRPRSMAERSRPPTLKPGVQGQRHRGDNIVVHSCISLAKFFPSTVWILHERCVFLWGIHSVGWSNGVCRTRSDGSFFGSSRRQLCARYL